MTTLAKEILYVGQSELEQDSIPLQAGPLTAQFHPETGWLRYIRIGDHEILRALYGAVRDVDWATVLPRISKVQIDSQKDSFQVSFEAVCKNHELDFRWKGDIQGDASGQITYQFSGQPEASFLSNRIGLCILHPSPHPPSILLLLHGRTLLPPRP